MAQSFLSDGVRIALSTSRRGRRLHEPNVLIHGFASNYRINWVDPRWVETLSKAGRRVVAFDNRGHGDSEKLYDPLAYRSEAWRATRRTSSITSNREGRRDGLFRGGAHASSSRSPDPERVRALILGGLGDRLVQGRRPAARHRRGDGAASLDALSDPTQRMFRAFAERTNSDLAALAACIRGSRQTLERGGGRSASTCPTLVAVGTRDEVAGDPHRLAAMFPRGEALEIPGRDHNLAVGDKVYKAGVLAFLARASEPSPALR